MANAPPAVVQIPSLPTFNNSQNWITLSEKIILNSNIQTNNTKFLTLFKALPEEIQEENSDLLSVNNNNTFTDLVARLKDRCRIPEKLKFEQKFTIEQMGDRSPTEFLRSLKSKYGKLGGVTPEELRFAYAKGMPPHYSVVVLSTTAANIEVAAQQLEDIWFEEKSRDNQYGNYTVGSKRAMQSKQNKQVVFSSQSDDITKEVMLENDKLKLEIVAQKNQLKSLEAKMQQLMQNVNKHNSDKRTDNNQSRRNNFFSCPSVPTLNDRQGVCYKHLKYGSKAYGCQAPCSFESIKAKRHSCTDACPFSYFLANGTFHSKNY